jgi:hypothetical protein
LGTPRRVWSPTARKIKRDIIIRVNHVGNRNFRERKVDHRSIGTPIRYFGMI